MTKKKKRNVNARRVKQRRHQRASHSGVIGSSDAESDANSLDSVLCALGIPTGIDLAKLGIIDTEKDTADCSEYDGERYTCTIDVWIP